LKLRQRTIAKTRIKTGMDGVKMLLLMLEEKTYLLTQLLVTRFSSTIRNPRSTGLSRWVQDSMNRMIALYRALRTVSLLLKVETHARVSV
jgi:hypothetical protein